MELKRHSHIGFDTIILFILALISLETNIPYVFDQLDFHQSMPDMGFWQHVLCPGGTDNPLVILKNSFTPFKLILRTLTLMIIIVWFVIDMMRKNVRWKMALASLLIFLHVIVPSIMLIQARLATGNHALAHDGGTIQIEESMKMVRAGKNPYSETFHGTPLEKWRGFSNNIIYHVPYMPGAFLYSIPFYVLLDTVRDTYDQRILHILLFIASFGLMAFVAATGEKCLTAWLVFALNPFFTRYFALGTNDIVILFCLLLAVTLMKKEKPVPGLMALAAACAVKQLAWFFVPFLVFYGLTVQSDTSVNPFKILLKCAGKWIPAAALFLATIIPFLVWDMNSFISDTFRYGSGGLPTSYPMQGFHGYGFATLLLFFRICPDGSAYFPFILFQTVAVVPVFVWLWRKFTINPTLPSAITSSACCLLIFMFFSRYLHANFIGFIVFWPVLSWCMHDTKDIS